MLYETDTLVTCSIIYAIFSCLYHLIYSCGFCETDWLTDGNSYHGIQPTLHCLLFLFYPIYIERHYFRRILPLNTSIHLYKHLQLIWMMPNNTAPTRASIDNTRMTRTASGVKLAYLASSQQGNSTSTPALSTQHNSEPNNHANTIPPSPSAHTVNTTTTTHKPLARERPFARDDYNSNTNPNSRPPSIRSATSFGRPLNRFMPGHHARHHSNYSNFSTMSETALPWTTRDIGFNAISGNLYYCQHVFTLIWQLVL